MKNLVGFAVLAALASSGASASTILLGDEAQNKMTYLTPGAITTAQTNGYSGVGTVVIFKANGGQGVCTGSLLNSLTVLTAAHCLAGTGGNATVGVSFFLPSLGNFLDSDPSARFNASAFAINPLYTAPGGGLVSGYDVALFTLRTAAAGYATYGLYDGNPLQQFTQVGTGTIGGPDGTNNTPGFTDYEKRVGTNLYEYYGDDVFTNSSRGVVLFDFDDGTAAHDVFGSVGGNIQRGIAGESNSSPGDSGGPGFINGRIATVTSFGVTGGIYNGYCGGDSRDPFNSNRTTAVVSTSVPGGCTNSSVGEISGNTLVTYNRQFITNYVGGQNLFSVPEPSTWAMLILGFGVIGGSLRRRSSKASLAFA